MSLEEELKNLILSKYKSLREFSIELDMPYSTIDSILKRGIDKASITNIIKICKRLNISADELADGCIVPANYEFSKIEFSNSEKELILKFRKLDPRGQLNIYGAIERELSYLESESK